MNSSSVGRSRASSSKLRRWSLQQMMTISLLQTSDSNAFFSNMVDVDRDTGNGIFPILIKDLKGGQVFSTEAAWVTKKAPFARGKETNNREWEIDTGDATLDE